MVDASRLLGRTGPLIAAGLAAAWYLRRRSTSDEPAALEPSPPSEEPADVTSVVDELIHSGLGNGEARPGG